MLTIKSATSFLYFENRYYLAAEIVSEKSKICQASRTEWSS